MSVPGVPPPSWDLTPAIDLLHSFTLDACHDDGLDPGNVHRAAKKPVEEDTLTPASGVSADEGPRRHKLGDFDALFTFLAQSSPPKLASAPGTQHKKAKSHVGRHGQRKDPHNKEILSRPDVIVRKQSKEPKLQKPELLALAPAGDGDNAPKVSVFPHPRYILRRALPAPIVLPVPAPSVPKGKRIVGSTIVVESLLTGTVSQRQTDLVSLLIKNHTTSRNKLHHGNLHEHLRYPLKTVPNGVHVFVDISNIMGGFHDFIKKARNIPLTTRVCRLPLSFQNFSLVLERGRPVSKRVLVGSDRFPAIDEAEKLGYEANILERVHKAKLLSPRKTKFLRRGYGSDGGSSSVGNALYNGLSSSSETDARPIVAKMVEQAVDEILHLKMLESIIDCDTPSTIVLATGDAAEAEYSDGFLKMIERALNKGWFVELHSFSMSTSRAYTGTEFRHKWGGKFRMFALDYYAEYLLDM